MPTVEWDDRFLLGVEQIDRHHRQLFVLVRAVQEHFHGGSTGEGGGIVLDALFDYTVYHFRAEERMMGELSYPGCADHKEEHDSFAAFAAEIRRDVHDGNTRFPPELLPFLKRWIIDHIQQTDFRFGQFVAAGSSRRYAENVPTVSVDA